MKQAFAVLTLLGAGIQPALYASAGDGFPDVPDAARAAQVIVLGEQHDNPAHHQLQAAWVEALQPRALVFEMLTPEQAQRVTPEVRNDAARLETELGWQESGWPDFAMYFPIFAAAPEAAVFGAGIPSERVRGLMTEDVANVAPELSARFALDQPLPEGEQELREALQGAAHCDALPEEMLPRMVSVQRLRDAALAQAALDALEQTAGPVVVITGNGHAREDWGAPALLRAAEPGVRVFALGQGEGGGAPEGAFGLVLDGPTVDRGDPCDAFR